MNKDEKSIVLNKLQEYPLLNNYLGRLIQQRLEIKGYEYGALTANLICAEENNDLSLTEIENALKIGGKHCDGFEDIFRIGKLSKNPDIADGRLLDLLAEVKTFQLLYTIGADNIVYLHQKSISMTVDFTSIINNERYAIEVTRLGLPESDNKKIEPTLERQILDDNGDLLGEFTFITTQDSEDPLQNTLKAAVLREYKQIKQFIQNEQIYNKGILVISIGRDYFVSKYARRDAFLPRTNQAALKKTIDDLYSNSGVSRDYLRHTVFIPGRPYPDIYIYPSFHLTKGRL